MNLTITVTYPEGGSRTTDVTVFRCGCCAAPTTAGEGHSGLCSYCSRFTNNKETP